MIHTSQKQYTIQQWSYWCKIVQSNGIVKGWFLHHNAAPQKLLKLVWMFWKSSGAGCKRAKKDEANLSKGEAAGMLLSSMNLTEFLKSGFNLIGSNGFNVIINTDANIYRQILAHISLRMYPIKRWQWENAGMLYCMLWRSVAEEWLGTS